MTTVKRLMLDLRQLRGEVAPLFDRYEEATARRDSDGAVSAKHAVFRTAKNAFNEVVPTTAGGIYMFVGADFHIEYLTYVGIARTFWNRFGPRFRDETCLDARLYDKHREEIWETAFRRMCVSMDSEPETRVGYSFSHVKNTLLFRNADWLVFFQTDGSREEVKAAESLLIYSAVSAGAPLVNIQERDKLSMRLLDGAELGLAVIDAAQIDALHWKDRAETLLSRFSGLSGGC